MNSKNIIIWKSIL